MKLFLTNKTSSAGGLFALLLFASLPVCAATSPNTDTADFILADFNGSPSTYFGGSTYPFTDNGSATLIDTVYGNSVLTSFGSMTQGTYDTLGNYNPLVYPRGHGGDSTNRALRFGFIFGDRKLSCGGTCTYSAYVGFTTGLKSYDTLDLTGSAGLAFWAKADSTPLTFSVSVTTRDTTTGAAEYAQSFTVDTAWKLCVINLVASTVFAQPTWSAKKPFIASRATGVGFGMNAGDNPTRLTNALWIDNLMIQKWKYVEPVVVDPPPDGLLAKSNALDHRFGVIRSDAGLRIRLPRIYAGQNGRVQALDAVGHVIAESSFQATEKEVELKFATQNVLPGTFHFRVIAAPSHR